MQEDSHYVLYQRTKDGFAAYDDTSGADIPLTENTRYAPLAALFKAVPIRSIMSDEDDTAPGSACAAVSMGGIGYGDDTYVRKSVEPEDGWYYYEEWHPWGKRMKTIYLAGFDVFYPDAVRRGAEMKRMCAEHGFVGLYPLDHEAADVQAILAGNTGLIDACDIVMANLNPFRGAEADSGTAFKVGYAHAKGKRIYGYLSDARTMREKLGAADESGFAVEDFGMALNLMLGCAATIVCGGLRECLAQAQNEN